VGVAHTYPLFEKSGAKTFMFGKLPLSEGKPLRMGWFCGDSRT
jgi:hypothetical protein